MRHRRRIESSITTKNSFRIIVDEEEEDELALSSIPTKRRRLLGNVTTSAVALGAPSSTSTPTQFISHQPQSATWTDSQDTSDEEGGGGGDSRSRMTYRELDLAELPGPPYPRSQYKGWSPPLPRTQEKEAIDALLTAFHQLHSSDKPPEYTCFRLDAFTIYKPKASCKHSFELVGLERLSQDRYSEFLVDGILSFKGELRYVQGVQFRILTVEGYGDMEANNLENQLCIQSHRNKRRDIWYQLGKPSAEYQRFYTPFLWLAQFVKHFVDYMLDIREAVTLMHFWQDFHAWLQSRYSNDATFAKWSAKAGLQDFRTTVVANVGFLWKECSSIDDRDSGLCDHPLWTEIRPHSLDIIPEQANLESKTVVTPFVYECFRSMYFGDHLVERKAAESAIIQEIRKRKLKLRLTPYFPHHRQHLPTPKTLASGPPKAPIQVAPGDVVSVLPDKTTAWGKSKQGDTTHVWLVYIQAVRHHIDQTLLDVLWLYEPKDTTIGKAYYPFPNELFLSDNCECGKYALDLDCVIEKVNITWNPQDSFSQLGLFVRQKFRTVHEDDSYDFVSICDADFHCTCEQKMSTFDECRTKYANGDTVLVREWSERLDEDRLQPAQIAGFNCAKRLVHLRRLLRRSEVDPSSRARANELVVTSGVYDQGPSKIIRRCFVRFFTRRQISRGEIETPYDRQGVGDFFFVEQEAAEVQSNVPFPPDGAGDLVDDDERSSHLPPILPGWQSHEQPSKAKMTGMGIFCGGGTFDRGLEEGGSVNFRYAVDWATPALHSYRANVLPPEKVQYFLGSVNDYLARAMTDDEDARIAKPGDINLLSAGSPCPGFSTLQSNKLSFESKQNASMVASVVSFVDFFVPEYLVLENVVTMTHGMGAEKNQNVFSQIVAALVGLGYQVQQFLMDAWSHASSQQRSRVFIVASAPGLRPLQYPGHSHAHPPGIRLRRALGMSSNGLPFGSRRDFYTTFPHVSAIGAVNDLPRNSDGLVQLCPRFPDHRTPTDETISNRDRIMVVPIRPRGMGLMQAKLAGKVRGPALAHCERVSDIRKSKTSRMYARIHPQGLFPTILTKLHVGDGITGRVVHWDQHRILTVMEARRAQNYPDNEVLVGNASQQLKIVGNSVNRNVALVLGLAFRESWMARDAKEDVGLGSHWEGASPEIGLGNAAGDDFDGEANAVLGAQDTAEEGNAVEEGEHSSNPILDNRSVKMALHLSQEDISDVQRENFKAIRRILASRGT